MADALPVSLVAALDQRGAIGRGNALPWHLPDDLKRFKALTLGRTILMGRRTAEAIGRALPGRRNLVMIGRLSIATARFAGCSPACAGSSARGALSCPRSQRARHSAS